MSAKWANHLGVSPFILLAFSLFNAKEGISKTTLKTLLMEVLSVPTPISSRKYKALNEGLPLEFALNYLLGVSGLVRTTLRGRGGPLCGPWPRRHRMSRALP